MPPRNTTMPLPGTPYNHIAEMFKIAMPILDSAFMSVLLEQARGLNEIYGNEVRGNSHVINGVRAYFEAGYDDTRTDEAKRREFVLKILEYLSEANTSASDNSRALSVSKIIDGARQYDLQTKALVNKCLDKLYTEFKNKYGFMDIPRAKRLEASTNKCLDELKELIAWIRMPL